MRCGVITTASGTPFASRCGNTWRAKRPRTWSSSRSRRACSTATCTAERVAAATPLKPERSAMADTRVLLRGLEDYSDTLRRHLAELRAHFEALSAAWQRFSSVYEGDAADEFRDHWGITTRRFREYIDNTERIDRIL